MRSRSVQGLKTACANHAIGVKPVPCLKLAHIFLQRGIVNLARVNVNVSGQRQCGACVQRAFGRQSIPKQPDNRRRHTRLDDLIAGHCGPSAVVDNQLIPGQRLTHLRVLGGLDGCFGHQCGKSRTVQICLHDVDRVALNDGPFEIPVLIKRCRVHLAKNTVVEQSRRCVGRQDFIACDICRFALFRQKTRLGQGGEVKVMRKKPLRHARAQFRNQIRLGSRPEPDGRKVSLGEEVGNEVLCQQGLIRDCVCSGFCYGAGQRP